jgi:RNA polymerase-binding transcription factor DksA
VNSTIIKKCEENLLQRRHEILPVLHYLAIESREAGKHDKALADLSCGRSEALVTARLASVYERELDDIETALSRIRTGTFGHCSACHQAIESSRLERFPRAEFCIRCKNI